MASSQVSVAVTPSKIYLGHVVIQVRVKSILKPELEAQNEMMFDRYANMHDLQKFVSVAAGSCAEHLNMKYKDRHDPEECAKVAREVLKKVVDDLMKGEGLTKHALSV